MADTLYIYGKHPVRDILARFPHTLKNIWIKESLKEKSVDEIVELAKKGKIPVSFATEKDLDAKVGDVNHQGVIALSKPYDYGSFDELVSNLAKAEKGTVVILDHIEDVHNFGAIIRSCAAFGVMAVCVSEHHQAPVTSAVFKTSAGTLYQVPIVLIGNINQGIEKLKKAGAWVYGLEGETGNPLGRVDFPEKTVVVVGGEAEGIRAKTRELCDELVAIPMKEGVESLNASVSVAITLYEVGRK
jgi:23S rRNA (guanosine2251-2'-O)-methyltransferase